MSVLSQFNNLRPFHGNWVKVVRYTMFVITGILLVVPLPYVIWAAVGVFRGLWYDNVSMSFPYIPVHYEVSTSIMRITLHGYFIYVLIGGWFWMMGFKSRAY